MESNGYEVFNDMEAHKRPSYAHFSGTSISELEMIIRGEASTFSEQYWLDSMLPPSEHYLAFKKADKKLPILKYLQITEI
jgi:hypothetical protein